MKAKIVEGDAGAMTAGLMVAWDDVAEPDGTLKLGKEIDVHTEKSFTKQHAALLSIWPFMQEEYLVSYGCLTPAFARAIEQIAEALGETLNLPEVAK